MRKVAPSPKQRRFATEYVRTGDERQAALSAGYPRKGLARTLDMLMASETVKLAIEEEKRNGGQASKTT